MPQSLEILVTWHGTDFKNRSRFFYTHRYGYLYGYLPYGKYFQESRAGLGLFFRAQCVLLFSVFGQFFSCQKIDQAGCRPVRPQPQCQNLYMIRYAQFIKNTDFCDLSSTKENAILWALEAFQRNIYLKVCVQNSKLH